MNAIATVQAAPDIIYPESDGLPMADNTRQFQWIMTIKGGLDAIFYDDPNVFVAGDLLWYPVEGEPKIRVAPDIFVVFGRPKIHRGSYKQWLEENIAPRVVIEIVSPGNSVSEMTEKFQFYEYYGVEEYYVYDPELGDLDGWLRSKGKFDKVQQMNGFSSPLLGVRFDMSGPELRVYDPAGFEILSYAEVVRQGEQERREKEQERSEKEQERREKEQERSEKEKERQRAEKLAAQLKTLGIEPEA